MQLDKQLKVGIGDMKLTRGDGLIITYALGSCIGLAFYDSYIKLGALLHVMLPERVNANDPNVFKYAERVKQMLREEGMKITGEDTGANYARTMSLDTGNGEVLIRTYGRDIVRI